METRVLVRIFLRTYFVGAAFNTKGMQNVGLAFIMEPGLKALYGADGAALRKARLRYLRHYNTHPFWTPLLVGIFLSMEQKIVRGMLSPGVLASVRTTTVYTLSALGDSFFGGSFLVFWSLVCVNLAARDQAVLLGLWVLSCMGALHLFKMFTFARGYAQGLAFLQKLKSWNLIDWSRRIKMGNAVLLALFAVHVLPGSGFRALVWVALAVFLAALSVFRTRDRCVYLGALLLVALWAPWERMADWGLL